MKPPFNHKPQSWLSRLAMASTLTLALLMGFFFFTIFFALFMVLAVIGIIWFWWQSRKIRRQQQQDSDIVTVEYEVLEEHPLLTSSETDKERNGRSDDPPS